MVKRSQKASARGASSKSRGSPTTRTVRVNRAPVLTLWGAVVAQRLGYDRETALTLGKSIAGLSAVAKGRRLGLIHETSEKDKKRRARAARRPE